MTDRAQQSAASVRITLSADELRVAARALWTYLDALAGESEGKDSETMTRLYERLNKARGKIGAK